MLSESTSSTNSQEHARLLKALRESELLRELSELLASSLDITHILQVLVKRTTEVCEVERCAVWLLDEAQKSLLPSAYHFSTQNVQRKVIQVADHMWHHSSLPAEDPLFHRLLQENGILMLEDLHSEQSMRVIAEKFFVRSVLLVALIREDRPVGMMSLDNVDKITVFSMDQVQLARTVGQQASVAIDNAHLYQQAQAERKRAEHLIERAQATYEVAQAVNSGEELSKVLEIATDHLVKGLEVQSAAIALLEKETITLASSAPLSSIFSPSSQDKILPQNIHNLPHMLSTAKKGSTQLVLKEQIEGDEQLWFQKVGMENIMLVPLMIGTPNQPERTGARRGAARTNRCVGFACINYTQAQLPATPGQYAFAQDIAAQCALAVEKAQILAKAQQAVALANERANTLDAIFNAMTEGILVLNMDGKVIISNDTASLFVNLTPHSKKPLISYLQNHPVYSLYGQVIPQEDFPLMRALRGEYIRGERFMLKRPDDSECAVEVNVVPLLDSEKHQIGIVSAFRDITEPLRIERRIRRALDTMLNAAKAISGIIDIREILYRMLAMTLTALNSDRGIVQLYDQKTQTFSPLLSIGFLLEDVDPWLAEQKRWLIPEDKRYTGLHAQLMEGHATLVSLEQYPDHSDSFHQSMILSAPITYNKRLLGVIILDRSTTYKKSAEPYRQQVPGTTRPLAALEFSAWDMAVVEGIAQFAGLAIEQTHWQQEAEIARTNEASMRESNALKDEFLAITAHEFRTPLTVILAHSQMMGRLLQKTADVPPELKGRFKESIFFIEEQTRQLTNIVNTFLEVTRINRGQIDLANEEIRLEEIVKETVANQNATSPIHQISYHIAPHKRPYLINGDKARLVQIFTNLLQNAIKYSPQGGPIKVSLQQCLNDEGKKVIEVCVADKGIGVPPDAQPYLFERFYRAPNISHSQTRGVGLGLYVVAEFLHLHGGTIRVESSGLENDGSRFIFTLPLLER